MSKTVTFKYLNHRGETRERTVDVDALEYVREPGFGYQAGWFLSGRCHDKEKRRSFALARIIMSEGDDPAPKFYRLLQL